MKKYLAFFRIRFINGLQYRSAALAGIFTQFFWGFMEIRLFLAFYRTGCGDFPMTFPALVSYIWLQQAFLTLYMTWYWEAELFDAVTSGNAVYELCRPVRLYNMWFVRGLAVRLSKAALRFAPVLIVAVLLPPPYRLTLPPDGLTACLFLISMVLAFLLVTAFGMIIYMAAFYMTSADGVKLMVTSLTEFLSGAVIPLPFLPDGLRRAVELLPFASMQNVPFRIYSQDLAGPDIGYRLLLQVFWLAVFILLGRALEERALNRLAVQGG